jgi:transcriptional regulator with XRE-family HTH domain
MEHPLRQYRERANLTQEELARKIGTSAVTVSRIESGRRRPSFAMLKRIAEATDNAVTPNDFILPDAEEDDA